MSEGTSKLLKNQLKRDSGGPGEGTNVTVGGRRHVFLLGQGPPVSPHPDPHHGGSEPAADAAPQTRARPGSKCWACPAPPQHQRLLRSHRARHPHALGGVPPASRSPRRVKAPACPVPGKRLQRTPWPCDLDDSQSPPTTCDKAAHEPQIPIPHPVLDRLPCLSRLVGRNKCPFTSLAQT